MTSPARILIVDDSPSARATLASALTVDGYELYFAESGQEALDMAPQLIPDVLLLDQMMPGMTGIEVCQRLREIPSLAELPILFVTALDDRATRMGAFEAGADDVLTKPVDRLEVRMRVRNIARLNRFRSIIQSRGDVDRMLQQVRQAYDETIAGWARALELRDSETLGHSERVTSWTVDLALAAGIDDEALEHVRRGALLHDIGKMGVPDSILRKPGPLDPEERLLIEQHPIFARNLLASIDYLAPSIDIPYCHHERWDGAGYPQGLAGEEIPLYARMFSVVDVFDALTSDRPYRSAWPRESALDYLTSQSGVQFDPLMAEIFVGLVIDGKLTGNPSHGAR